VLPVLAVAFILKEPFPLPLAGVTVSQEVALLDTFQALLAVTLTVKLSAANDGFQVLWDRVRFAAGAPWVTVTVRDVAPVIVAVMVPDLAAVPLLAVTFILKVPLPLPLPLAGVTVSHEVALLDTFQALLANTLTVKLSAPEDGLHVP